MIALFLLPPAHAWSSPEKVPPHQPILLPGVHAYADQLSIAAGDPIRFHVSSTEPYALSVYRLGLEVDDPASDTLLKSFPASGPRAQPIHPGSYVHIENGLPADKPLDALTLECWVRPWKLTGWQGILTQHDYPEACGFGLFLDNAGAVTFYLGDGGLYRKECIHSAADTKLTLRQWHHLAATWDDVTRTKTLWIDGQRAGSWTTPADGGTASAGPAPLRLAAYGQDGLASHFLDGDLAMPAIYNRVLTDSEIASRFVNKGLPPPSPEGALASWLLAEENGSHVADNSPNHRHGRIVNHATWMIGGPSFDAFAVPRYGHYDPMNDPQRGHGLRFASDDLYDCRWDATHSFDVPVDAKPGIYTAKLHFDLDGEPAIDPVTFIVRKARNAPKAPIALMCATNTWRAYGATPFAKNTIGPQFWPTKGLENSHPGAPAYCMYRDHAAGQPSFQVGRRMPLPAAGPEVLYSPPEFGYSHLMRGERFTHAWLEKSGYQYDVISNEDLHRDPDLLSGYKVLIVNGHDEYWSVSMWEGADKYLKNGGNAIVLSGNTAFWRVTFDDDGVMECRKFQKDIGGRPHAGFGEIYHSDDGKRGSLMRNCGYEAWKLIGLDCIGWWGGRDKDSFGVYETEIADHFLFHRPEEAGLAAGDTFGHAPGGGLPRVGGHEADVRLSTLLKMTPDVPEGAELPEEPENILTLARIRKPGQRGIDYFTRWSPEHEGTVCELIYWERPGGGIVFNAGAIAAGWALSADPKFQAVMRNTLHHFGVSR